ncbi:unnamed protein product [Bursaphelenchus xylophilus]|uniref:(pine wood nematode) hypothetical protein n=1 Tax=Bursaphelenchus xylophilus TaxID=6326 RepID=A0A1I7S9P8_BURXY|nr:unnamed protein product [Bursaphelenchus xylophilus]CAG9131902.1 unnamed protein product [Bursaphelenchus xylophilus]
MRFFCIPLFACNTQVDSLDKRQCNLQSVPGEVERYARNLEELLLDMNHIKELPKFLFRLPKLRRLCLGDNDLHRLPPDIGHLVGLVELNISRNDISDLPEDLKNCKQLLILDVSSNPIARLPDSITMVSSLTQLSLNDTSLTRLPVDIGRLTMLRSLEARENHLRTLPASVAHLQRLQRLDLGQNELDELPAEIGALRSLQEFYADENSLETLPEQILNCKNLEQIDISTNRIIELPNEIGELDKLTDLILSNNCISNLPNSIGRLRRLSILKMDNNNLTKLTPAIGSCSALTEVYLTSNLLSELPSTIGNLVNLSTLNLDKNQLTSIPSLIGNCQQLTLLSLRDNQIAQLPMEIGKLAKLRVLDVVNNKLESLPYTVNVLYELQALWLSENQSQAMLKLQPERDPATGINVLTCYLLPQQGASHFNDSNSSQQRNSAAFLGGPKVHFGDQKEEEDPLKGAFERHNTPHPKPHQAMKNRTQVDGHVIQHEDDRRPSVVSLTKKTSVSEKSDQLPSTSLQPKSSLKHPPVHNQPGSESPSYISSAAAATKGRNVAFALPADVEHAQELEECRLKRVNTPHYGRAARLAQQQQQQQQQQQSGSPFSSMHRVNPTGCHVQENRQPFPAAQGSTSSCETKRLTIRREPNVGLGLSIAGGIESTPYIDNDTGLFVSKLIPGAPAEKCGLLVGDKLLEINGTSMVNQRHDVAVKCVQQNTSVVELVIQRALKRTPSQTSLHQLLSEEKNKLFKAPGISDNGVTTGSNTTSTTIHWDPRRQLGMSMLHTYQVYPNKSPLRVQYITPGGLVDQDGKIGVGDEIISINGKSLLGMEFEKALGMLQRPANDRPIELHLVVQRNPEPLKPLRSDLQKSSNLSTNLSTTLSTNTPSNSALNSASNNVLSAPAIVDGTVEFVELARDVNNSLGLSIVGGVDHCSHPFGIDRPGVFISKISRNSAAAQTQRLRVGDRILSVNGIDLTKAKHAEAVQTLKNSGQLLKLGVSHDPQPKGLREITFTRRVGEQIGLAIFGGINCPPANPTDPTDEGIFIERVEPASVVSEVEGLHRGVRIIEVNDESLLGCTKSEAAQILRKTEGRVRLLICDGFNSGETTRERAESSFASSSITLPSISDHHTSLSTLPQFHETPAHRSSSGVSSMASERPKVPARSPDSRLSTPFSVTPTPTNSNVTTFPSEKPPNGESPESPENVSFASKLQRLETASKLHSIYPQPSAQKIGGHVVSASSLENNNNIKEERKDGPLTRTIPITIKNEAEQLKLDDKKSNFIDKQPDWVKTRLTSLDNEPLRAEILMNRPRQQTPAKGSEMENKPLNSNGNGLDSRPKERTVEIKFADDGDL